MKKQFKLGVIGCGFMASAILKGVILSDLLRGKKIVVSDVSDEQLDSVEELGVMTTNDNRYVAENSEYVLLSVNYRDFDAVVRSLKGYCPEKVISIVSGATKNAIKNSLGTKPVRVARCIPNLPCTIGSGAIGIDMSDYNNNVDDTEFITKIFDCLGTVVSVDESKMDAVTALGMGGSAVSFMLINGLIDAGVEQGLTKDEAKIIAVQTVLGSAEMVMREDYSLNNLLMLASNKGGIGVEAVKVLNEEGFDGILSKTMASCVTRAKDVPLK